MNSRRVSCENASVFSRPGGGVQVGAEGSNGGKVLGIVMPGGPLCAVAGAEPTFAPKRKNGNAQPNDPPLYYVTR